MRIYRVEVKCNACSSKQYIRGIQLRIMGLLCIIDGTSIVKRA